MSRYNINYYAARSGRVIKEDGTYVNVADGLNEDGSQNARIIYGPDGQPLSESNPLPVQLKGSNIGQGYFNETRTGTFAPGESFVVVDYDEPVIIDAMDWVPRNETQARIKIHVRGGGDQLINTLGTSTEGTFSPRDIVDGVSLFFDVVRFDLEASPDPLMRFHLKEPLYCPDGVRITLYNRDDEESFRNSLQVRGRFA